jgi:hypothetical protein
VDLLETNSGANWMTSNKKEPAARDSGRGGRIPEPDVNDQPDPAEGAAEGSDNRGLGDLDGNRAAGTGKARGPEAP